MLLLFGALLIVLYFYSTRNHSYWSKRNVKHNKPIPIFGNHFKHIFGLESAASVTVRLYKKFKHEKVIGYYRGNTPELIIKDPDLIRKILSTDFSHFHKRGLAGNPEVDPLMYSLFRVDGDVWKLLRYRLTPAFTIQKLKCMFPLVVACAEKLQAKADKLVHTDEYKVRDLMARYTIEFTGAYCFGIDMNTINDGKSKFKDLAESFFKLTRIEMLLVGLRELYPEFTNKISASARDKENKLREIFYTICKSRHHKPSERNDFIDMLLELKNEGVIEGESIDKRNPDGSSKRIAININVDHLIGQMFVFFAAGFETSSASTSYLLHELAYHPEIQQKVQKEIDEVLYKHSDQLCYEAISEMKYLDLAFKEALRKFPPGGVIHRQCCSQYTLPGTDITIDPGVKIMIPVQALHMDEQYYEDPEKFIPERFLSNEVHKRHKYVYLPFGKGPRNCIGARLGHLQSLAGLAALLHKFSVQPSKSSQYEVQPNPKSHIVQSTIDGLPLKLIRR